MLPPTFVVAGMVIQSSILPKLERVSGVKACRFCLHPHTVGGCSQVALWSHTSTRQTLAIATTARSHDTTSVSTSIACPPPGLPPQGTAAPTSTYSEALAFGQGPQTRIRGVSWPPLPRAGYPSVDPHKIAPTPRMGAPIRQECLVTTQAKNSLPTTGTSSRPLHPFHWGQERSYPRDDVEEITGVGVPSCLCRPRMRALHKGEGAIPKKTEEAPGQNPQGLAHGRSRSHLRKGFEQRQQSQSTPHPGGRAFASTSGAPSAPPVQLGCFHSRHLTDVGGIL